MRELRQKVESEVRSILSFWLKYAIDEEYGGFRGQITNDLAIDPRAAKDVYKRQLYEHLQRSFNYTLSRLGPHGLPLIGRADWNDCLNLNCFSDTPGQSFQTTTNKDGKVAESVFIAGLFVLAAKELAAIAAKRNRNADAKQCLAEAAKMAKVVYQHGLSLIHI